MPVRLYATMIALDGKQDIVALLLEGLKVDVDAEPGCERFIPYRLSGKPNHFHVEETYRDKDAFSAHMASAHGIAFNKAILDLVENGKSTVTFLDPL